MTFHIFSKSLSECMCTKNRKKVQFDFNLVSKYHGKKGYYLVCSQSIHPSIHQLFRGNPEALTGQLGHIIPPTLPRSCPRSPSGGTCPEILTIEESRGILITCPSHLIWLLLRFKILQITKRVKIGLSLPRSFNRSPNSCLFSLILGV